MQSVKGISSALLGKIHEDGPISPLVASLSMMAKAVPDSFEHCDGFPVISSISGRIETTTEPILSSVKSSV